MRHPHAPRQALDGIFRLVSSGQLEHAAQECAALLGKHPEDVNIIGLQGAILLKLGRLDTARQTLEKAVAMEPGFAKPHEDLGRLFLETKEPGQAAQYFSRAIELDDRQASAYSGLAIALGQMGKEDEALSAQQAYLERSPITAALLEAERLLDTGDNAGADRLCNEQLRSAPENTQVLRMLARIASEDERHGIAEGLLRRIIKLSPNDYLPRKDLGRFLHEQSRFPEAIEMFGQAVSINDSAADTFRLLGDAQAVIGRSAAALASYERALEIQVDEPRALAGQGHMLRIVGKRDDAIACYEKCTALRPEFGDAWWNLASVAGYRLSDDQIGSIHRQLESDELNNEAEIGMRFALARAMEAREDFDAAWEEYARGNALKRRQVNYDPVQTEVTHDAIIERFNAEFLAGRNPAGDSVPAPIFIVGMPRSGSTLLEQILASHSQVEGAGELPYVIMLSTSLGRQRQDGLRYPEVVSELGDEQLASLGKAYIYHSRVHRSLDLPRFTDKMPANFSHIGLIHLMLPNARIIDARRHPMATCLANFRQLYAQGKNQTYDLVEFAEYFLEYRRVMDHWQQVLPRRVLEVQYENVVADLEGQARRMLEHCGLTWEDACLDFHRNSRPVNTASAEQVREPIYSGAVEFWRHYERQLEPLREILAPVLPD